jgi:hypothetical protein
VRHPTAADLDGDGLLEVLFGNETYHHDGTPYWSVAGPPQHPHVANLDADPEPEVFLTSTNGITVVEHDGTLKYGPVRPTDPNPAPNCWGKPAVVHDFNGDGKADIAASTCSDYTMYDVGRWRRDAGLVSERHRHQRASPRRLASTSWATAWPRRSTRTRRRSTCSTA